MNKYFLVILCLLSWYSYSVAQQPIGNNDLTCYMCASASSGELKSATMTVNKDGGTVEKLENGDFVLKLNRGEFVEFSFTLPESASGVEATVKYRANNDSIPCFIRWNGNNPNDNESNAVINSPKKKENLYYKKYVLKDPKRNNVIRVTAEGVEGLKFYNIIITYKYCKSSSTVNNFSVTLDSPDPAKSILDTKELVFKWSGVGDCPKEGCWVTLQFCDNDKGIWKTVPGAEYIDIKSKYWKDPSHGSLVWKSHNLTVMPDFKIVLNKDISPLKYATNLFDEEKFYEALVAVNQLLKEFPRKKELVDLKYKIVRTLNPFDIENRNDGTVISVILSTIAKGKVKFEFVYVKDNDKGFWILNQEVSQAQWQTIMKGNPSKHQGDIFPVENISWDSSKNFCNAFKKLLTEKYDANIQVTLPTEKQWELACKPLQKNQIHYNNYTWGFGAPDTISVSGKPKNSLGIYGMQGNVAEWCLDNITNNDQTMKVARGGSCYDRIDECQPKSRKEKKHDKKDGYTGFRFVVIPQ